METRIVGGQWEGLDELGDEELNALRAKAELLVKTAVLLGESELKRTLTGQRSGRTYKVSRTGALHVASAPGEPPAVLFGHLRNSVGHSDPKWEGDTISAEYGPGLGTKPGDPTANPEAYAVRLEYGGIDSRGIKIEPRPYMAPTEERIRPMIEGMFESGL